MITCRRTEPRRLLDHTLLTNRNAHSRDMVRATAENLCNHGQTRCVREVA
ncbi:hypothetical protein MGG_17966 [Pyricularia oryzae 70-15]|uniref:Uncharacterized protein n=2 Tax=Pyricularia oryzae TaxID=318829 RepID=G5EHS8_PYRO7|nr:uncharacterized protein MGG_17966 [Pyricularia oryzae 70-15]EAQ71122.1 hypothetical protein MGCH7_ch7g529 [Pyricularia oryzae 70-15]EHA46225.1 hypothetical protein MGG_17966 [Pyricularia oryzae 70-15]